MENFSCPTGFLIAQDEEGNYVPFLVKVRDQEILWNNSESNFSKEFLEKLKELGCNNIIENPPSPSYSFELDGWNGKIESDGTISAVREYRFTEIEEFFVLRDKEDTLMVGNEDEKYLLSPGKKYYDTNVSFPLRLLRKGIFISTTLNTTLNELKTATSNIILDDKFVNGVPIVDEIGLSLSFMDTPTTVQGDVVERYTDNGISLRSSCSYFNDGLVTNDPCGYDEENEIFYFDNTVGGLVENSSSIFVEVRGTLADMKIFTLDNSKEITL